MKQGMYTKVISKVVQYYTDSMYWPWNTFSVTLYEWAVMLYIASVQDTCEHNLSHENCFFSFCFNLFICNIKVNIYNEKKQQNKNMHTSMINYSSDTLESEKPGIVIYLYSTICRMPCIKLYILCI